MTLRDHLRIFRRRWYVLAAALIIGLALGALVRGGPPQSKGYEATTILLLRQLGPDEASLRPGLLAGIDTVTTLVTVGEVPVRVSKALALDDDGRLVDRVSAGGEKGTGLIRITAVARRPEMAEKIALTFATELQSYLLEREGKATSEFLVGLDARIDALEEEVRSLSDAPSGSTARARLEAKITSLETLINERGRIASAKQSTLQIIGSPSAREVADPSLSIPTGATRMAILGMLGLAFGIGIVILSERVDTSIRSRSDAERAFGAPVLAEIPTLRRRERNNVVTLVEPNSPAADAFGLLAFAVSRRTTVPSPNGTGDGRRGSIAPILVTSASHGEGKTTVAINVAAALAEMGLNVLLISADFRSATTHGAFRVEDPRGLSDALLAADGSGAWLAAVVRESGVRGLRIISSGSAPDRLSELLSSDAMHRAMDEARATADVVIVDAAPILVARDAAALVGEVGSVLLVAGAEQVTTDLAMRASEQLEHLGAHVIGVVLNRSADPPAARAAGRSRRAARVRHAKPPAVETAAANGASNGHVAVDLTGDREDARLGDDPPSSHGS